jgi:hypothetical protein
MRARGKRAPARARAITTQSFTTIPKPGGIRIFNMFTMGLQHKFTM